MNDERWRQIEQVCCAALQREASERVAFLDEACAGDVDLRNEVESLLRGQPESSSFLEAPPALTSGVRGGGGMERDVAAVLAAGTLLGPYRIIEFVGAGGMGQVYEAVDQRLDRRVAIKFLSGDVASDPELHQRFEREAHALAALNHPNILTVHDVGSCAGTPYLVTELLEGQTLRELMSRCALTQRQVLSLAVQIARGLDAAHSRGVVHGDLKPENLIVTTAGHVKVLDFGLARLASCRLETEATASTAAIRPAKLLGTIGYIAPEQLRALPADHRSDVFAFGAVLFEMLAHKHPFIRDTAAATLSAVLEEDADFSTLTHTTPAVSGIVRRCLEKAAADRFQSARDLTVALETVLAEPATTPTLQRFDERSPYPGLSSFTEQDAAFFFGREEEVSALWTRLRDARIVAVIGPSGAGKTSFVRAGVLASRPEEWDTIVCTPGSAPLRALGQALAPELTADPGALRKLLEFDDPGTALELMRHWRSRHGEALLVVDQFEELFTLNAPDVQERFAALLGRLAGEGDVHVLLSMRDDFLMRCAEHPPLAPVFHALIPLPVLRGRELRRALVEPARKRGYEFDDESLVDEMVGSVATARAPLPLLAFAVSRLWEKRDVEKKLLTRQASEEIGGIAGALAQHAEATLDRIGSARQGVVREIFRNLVTAHGTRVAADRDELLSAFTDRKTAEEALDTLVDARLLTSFADEHEISGQPERHRVEIVHESLLDAWPRLVRWRAQDQEGALLRDQLRQAVRLWEDKGRRPELLWTGTAYQEFRLWRERYPGSLTALEEDFARAMSARARRKRRFIQFATACAFLLITGIAVAIGISRRQATTARDESKRQALRADAARFLALAELRLRDDPTEALAFTIASLEQGDTQEARTFVMKVLHEAPPAFELVAGSDAARVPAFSPDGKWLATAGHATDALVWPERGGDPRVLPGHITSPRGSNVARWASNDLLVTGAGSMIGTRAHVWSLPDAALVQTIDFGGISRWQASAGQLFAETLEPGSDRELGVALLRSWAPPDGEPTILGTVDFRELRTPRFESLEQLRSQVRLFAPNGRNWLYAGDRDLYYRPLPVGTGPDRHLARLRADIVWGSVYRLRDRLVLADASGQTHVWSLFPRVPVRERLIAKPETASFGMLPSSTGRWLTGDPNADRQVRLWDLRAWSAARPLTLRRSGSWYGSILTLHPRDDWAVASTANLKRLTFWPLRNPYPSVVDGYSPLWRPVAFSADGKWLATGWSEAGQLRLWPLPGSGRSEVKRLSLPEAFMVTGLAFEPKGRYVFVVGATGQAWIVPIDRSTPRKLHGFSQDVLLYAAAVSPSGRLVAAADWYGEGEKALRVWNVETGDVRRFELPLARMSAAGNAKRTGFEGRLSRIAFVGESTVYTLGDGGLRRWDLETGLHELLVQASPNGSMAVSFPPGAAVVFAGERGPSCRQAFFHDLAAGTSVPVTAFGDCAAWPPGATALDPSGTVAVVGGNDGGVRVGKLPGDEAHLLVGHVGSISRVAISPDLRWVATTGEDNTLRLWPMPDLSKPPLHTLPLNELLSKLRTLTNLRVVRDQSSADGWKLEVGPFPGWKNVPTWQ